MELRPPFVDPAMRNPDTAVGAIRAWRTGQVLAARVLAPTQNGQATLRVGRDSVPVQTRIALELGQELQLRVARTGERPLLRLLPPAAPMATVDAALRAALPRQQPMTRLLANLAELARPSGRNSGGSLLPEEIQRAAREIVRQLPAARTAATTPGLQGAVRNSGIFAEARMGQALAPPAKDAAPPSQADRPPPAGDFKIALLRLLANLLTAAPRQTPTQPSQPGTLGAGADPETPPPLRGQFPLPQPRLAASLSALAQEGAPLTRLVAELTQQLEGALARILVSQTASLPVEDGPTQTWVLEVPLRDGEHADVLHLRIERHRRGQQEEEFWSVSIALDLEELGPMRAQLTLHGQQISTTLWAEREATAKLMDARLEELRGRLELGGLSVGTLACKVGAPSVTRAPGGDAPLLSEQA